MKEFWDERFSQSEFAYGTDASIYVQKVLPQLTPGKILFPAEGEGRNSVFAAQLGWKVSAFDFSIKGKEKADKFAQLKGVKVDYTVQSFMQEQYETEEFDAICMSSVHFPPNIKTAMHQRLNSYLKVGGYFIIDAFSKEHREINKLNPAAGGPPDADMMYSIEEIKHDFGNYEFIELKIERPHLNEGFGHVGESSMIRFIGKKIRLD
ncbi:class I SAM-dependent methyltransferase [Saccharicrinis aurantiacus]|uniref:class I SAM-dependent methyltransferase n=1 Tax=Saccharicrinis aurantiacus TaxID=1849719 RepID=UPI000838F26E|nr:class I SAM-dependent methyltransferase [Saccharicrinis aurantiacus]